MNTPGNFFILEERSEIPFELCIYCERLLPGKRKLICGSYPCLMCYNADWMRGKRAAMRHPTDAAQNPRS